MYFEACGELAWNGPTVGVMPELCFVFRPPSPLQLNCVCNELWEISDGKMAALM